MNDQIQTTNANPPRHSKCGIASLILGILSLAITLLPLLVWSGNFGRVLVKAMTQMAAMAALLPAAVALVLGIVALCQKGRRKGPAVIGIAAIVVVFVNALAVLGS